MADMKKMGDGYEIPPPLLRKINQFARELTLPELGLLIGSLHMCHLKLKGKSGAELRNHLCKVICSVDERNAIAYDNCVANLAKFMTRGSGTATLGYYQNDLRHYSQEIADKYLPLMPHLGPQTVARLLNLVSQLFELDALGTKKLQLLCFYRFVNMFRRTTQTLPRRASHLSWLRQGTSIGQRTLPCCSEASLCSTMTSAPMQSISSRPGGNLGVLSIVKEGITYLSRHSLPGWECSIGNTSASSSTRPMRLPS